MPSMAVLAEEQHSGAIPVEDGFTADIDAVNAHDQVRPCCEDQGVHCGHHTSPSRSMHKAVRPCQGPRSCTGGQRRCTVNATAAVKHE